MSAIASIAQSGLQAAQQRLNASAHNVANQQTEGFAASRWRSRPCPKVG
jgi:flagellar basal-body rod protein FlgC